MRRYKPLVAISRVGALPDPGSIELVKTSDGWRIDKLPTREVARVLILAGREAVQGADGTWAVRRAPEPTAAFPNPETLEKCARRPVARRCGSAARGQECRGHRGLS